MAGHPIDSSKIEKGALHRQMGIPQGQKIPVETLRQKMKAAQARGDTKTVKRVNFAINAKTKFHHGKG